MPDTCKVRLPIGEQIRFINEYRQSGMTDADWARKNDVAVSTFYNWNSRCWKAAADQIPSSNNVHLKVPPETGRASSLTLFRIAFQLTRTFCVI